MLSVIRSPQHCRRTADGIRWLTVALQLWTGEWDGAIHIRDMLRADVIGTLSGPPVHSRLGHSYSAYLAACILQHAAYEMQQSAYTMQHADLRCNRDDPSEEVGALVDPRRGVCVGPPSGPSPPNGSTAPCEYSALALVPRCCG